MRVRASSREVGVGMGVFSRVREKVLENPPGESTRSHTKKTRRARVQSDRRVQNRKNVEELVL